MNSGHLSCFQDWSPKTSVKCSETGNAGVHKSLHLTMLARLKGTVFLYSDSRSQVLQEIFRGDLSNNVDYKFKSKDLKSNFTYLDWNRESSKCKKTFESSTFIGKKQALKTIQLKRKIQERREEGKGKRKQEREKGEREEGRKGERGKKEKEGKEGQRKKGRKRGRERKKRKGREGEQKGVWIVA